MKTGQQTKHLLLAIGERMLQRITTHVLREAGYQVTAAQDGLETLYIINTFHGTQKRFDLLLVDFSLPQLSCADLVKRLAKQGEYIPIIIISPSKIKISQIEIPSELNIKFIETPFLKKELLMMIQKIIDESIH